MKCSFRSLLRSAFRSRERRTLRRFHRFAVLLCLAGGWNANAAAANPPAQQALIISIPLRTGTPSEMTPIFKMEGELIKAIDHSHAGEYDGNEVGERKFIMYMYGPSADTLLDIATPVLGKYELNPGSRAVKRYGKPGAKEESVPLDVHESPAAK